MHCMHHTAAHVLDLTLSYLMHAKEAQRAFSQFILHFRII